MKREEEVCHPDRELYALLQVPPDASNEDIRSAYRHFAQVYHPDKYQEHHMKEIATKNFQRICEACEILSNKNKRQIYDLYGIEGLASGLELGTKLKNLQEFQEEVDKLRQKMEREKMAALFRPSGTIVTNLSLPGFLCGDSIMKRMAMFSQVQSQLSKRNTIAFGGSVEVNENAGGAACTMVFRHQHSSASSIELMGSAGLRALIGVQTTRNLSLHSTATISMEKSLRDGSINLTNSWTRQLSEATKGSIQLSLGPESSIKIGWQKKDEGMSASGDVKLGTQFFEASANYTHHFSSKVHSRIAGKFSSTALEVEAGAGRKLSDFSTVRMLYAIGIQGFFWKLELHCAGQKIIIPVLFSKRFDLFRHLNGALVVGFIFPPSFYFAVKKFIADPYYVRREKTKALERKEKTSARVREARAAAQNAQQLQQNVANRKRERQMEINGLVIVQAVYGNCNALKRTDKSREVIDIDDVSDSEVIDVTTPISFLVDDFGQLRLHHGVKKSGIMGFYDPCPGEPKLLHVVYTLGGERSEELVDDYAGLSIPKDLSG